MGAIGIRAFPNWYEFVVFDTSILNPSRANLDERAAYRKDLTAALASERLVTVDDVVREAERYLQHPADQRILELLRKRRCDLADRQRLYFTTIARLWPQAYPHEIIGLGRQCPLTDLKVASLALTLAAEGPTALLSADRALNGLVQSALEKPSPHGRHRLDVYSFLRGRALYLPYPEERQRARPAMAVGFG